MIRSLKASHSLLHAQLQSQLIVIMPMIAQQDSFHHFKYIIGICQHQMQLCKPHVVKDNLNLNYAPYK